MKIRKFLTTTLMFLLLNIMMHPISAKASSYNVNTSTYSTLQQAITACVSSGESTITVTGSPSIYETQIIPEGKEIILKSANENTPITIKQNAEEKRHFEVRGTLILQDIVLEGRSEIIDGGIYGRYNGGGGVYVNGGSLVMKSGSAIRKCYTGSREDPGEGSDPTNNAGGAVYLYKGTFQMYDGEITNNTSETFAGGVEVDEGVFTMEGGTIANNMAKTTGGGVFVDQNGKFIMKGGTIKGNQCWTNGAGVLVFSKGMFNMKNGVISGNASLWDEKSGISGHVKECILEGGTIEGTKDLYKYNPTISGTKYYDKTYGDTSFELDSKLEKGDAVLNYQSSDTKVAAVSSSGAVTIKGAGRAVITVTAPETDYYYKATETITVNAAKAEQILDVVSSYSKTAGDSAFSLNVKRLKGDGTLSYSSSDTSVAAVSSTGQVTIKKAGKTVIIVKAQENANYKEKTEQVTITVKAKTTNTGSTPSTVKVKKAVLSSVKSSSRKKIIVKWKKVSDAAGYQIQYSTNSKFKKANKTVKINKKTTTKAIIPKLKSGKKYYVRVRAYKNVSGKKIYGAWSGKKAVKVK